MDTGVYTRKQLLRSGETNRSIRLAVQHGDLRRLRHGWYANDGARTDVVEAVIRGGAMSCVSALDHHGLWVAPGYGSLHVRGSKHLQRHDFCHPAGGPYPVDTAVDSAELALACATRCMSDEDWIAAADSYLNQRGKSVDELRAILGETVSPPNRRLLDRCDGRAQSGTESIARVRLRSLHYDVVVQPQIRGVGRVDLRIGRLLIECDSKLHHTSLRNYRNDRRRDRTALVNGWLTMRLTYDDILYDWPAVLADIRAVTRPRRHRIR
ncbi:hypothetical protein GOARA_082_00470 [Gordonia araii NBRC 100433]|uniref:DUF559 domain-containing protein n=1 Tax=Gordonia araii NBRC 100433 TaxID=1073574 RepID=G7H734_9ACTN|nr:type IV toxin-antitoxin system AbiEi family antitoxin domain-containing protein [Gordonia araii]NNG97655.1 type IV toxin-antitoxin system AbiEi family antitoxin domain-containing protein [Gordonia araii NBRC 100433]GAB11659.1 hypothetical protein GOARA_082_00470 [Gordonia araii NBRC 100433]